MVISASRRTDIPAFYSDWFIKRLQAGYVYVRNPVNPRQISRVSLDPELVDCIVFWTKDPQPMLKQLEVIQSMGYAFYFQFTVTPYWQDLEPGVRDKKEIIRTFQILSEQIGKEKVILRYDPVLITPLYSEAYHLKAFDRLCSRLQFHTEKVIFSYLDWYRKIDSRLKTQGIRFPNQQEQIQLAEKLAEIASWYGLCLETCGEELALHPQGITSGKCIDGALIERILGCELTGKKGKEKHRKFCGCMKSIDIGMYDSCLHGCVYCYANQNAIWAKGNYFAHNPDSPLLFGQYEEEAVVDRKNMKRFRKNSDGKS